MDFFGDFDDDFDEDEFMEDDLFEDSFEFEEDLEPFDGDSVQEDEPEQAESQDDDFTARDAFILGGSMGFAYEKGLKDRKRKNRKKFSDDSD